MPGEVAKLFLPRPFIPHEIPLGDGNTARLVLPANLTEDEAEHICGVIRALAFEGHGFVPGVPREVREEEGP